ncbi:MAG: transposase, partial [Planctomycetota bacterium]
VASDLRGIFKAADDEEARRRLKLATERWRPQMPRLAAWMESNMPEGFAVIALPLEHRRRLRTTNLIECIKTEIKRRTRA